MANVTTPTVPGTPTVPAVSPAPKPRALQKFVRGADGKIKVMYVTEQGLPIPLQISKQVNLRSQQTTNLNITVKTLPLQLKQKLIQLMLVQE